MMNVWLRRLVPVLVIAAAIFVGKLLIAGREAPPRSSPPRPVPVVKVIETAAADYRIELQSQGVVEPALQASLVAQVAGIITGIDTSFVEGGYFGQGEALLRIDDRDYQAARQIAEAELVKARLQVAEETALAEQAARDWARLNSDDKPSDLALRKPQLANARAALMAAEARLGQAELDLERTTVRAPWAGRLHTRNVDLGQFVTAGQVLADLYATAHAEVRLPLTARQLQQLDLNAIEGGARAPTVRLYSNIGTEILEWQGVVDRAEGVIDPSSRQSFVVAKVADPYGRIQTRDRPLQIGQFVEARIEGRLLQDVLILPRTAVRTSGAVYVVDADDRLQIVNPEILWRDEHNVVVSAGLMPGVRVVTSALALASAGMPVKVRAPEQAVTEAR